MQIAEQIQALIHKLEVGTGSRVLRVASLVMIVVALAVLYDLRAYRNFSTAEAMDSAQVARNLAEGRGYTTSSIRPFSLYLVQKHNLASHPDEAANTNADLARIRTGHPDLANAPVYPTVLAGLMKVLPFDWTVETKKTFWSEAGSFQRYQPEFLIAIFNQFLFLAVVTLTFFIARKLFDQTVAWLAAILVGGCDVLWQFSVSGLSTMLLLVIFLGLAWCILKIEEQAGKPQPPPNLLMGLCVATGALAGAGALTRYAFGWVIIPVVVFVVLFSGPRRAVHAATAFAAFAVVLAPWIARNLLVSGTPFGTAGYAVVEGTFTFSGFRLEQSLHPDLRYAFWLTPYFHKLLANLRGIFENDLPKLGGSWAAMLFLTGLLLGLRSAAARRLRYFLLMCLGVFAVVQALGRTQLSEESPGINSENLLVLLVPLAFIYAIVFFLTILEQMKLPAPQMHFAALTLFVIVACLPLIATLSPPKLTPIVSPYYPPDIQKVSGWMKEDELMMSDVPCAVAWYGRRQCLWLTLDSRNNFFVVNDYVKNIQAVYLTPKTIDGKLLTDCVHAGNDSWGSFVLKALTQSEIPPGFPLRRAPFGLASGLFLTDRERWLNPSPSDAQR